jgi:5-methylcytosine-specific restriction endonuclease McrA
MARRAITKALRVRVFGAAEGKCHLCGLQIQIGEKWEIEHVRPLWLSNDDSEANMAPAHVHCHKAKTSEEAPVRAKTTRMAAKHIGATAPKQKIASKGFQKREKRKRIELPALPRKEMFR